MRARGRARAHVRVFPELPEAAQNIFSAKPFPPRSGDFAIVAGGLPIYDDIECASELFQLPKAQEGVLDDVAKAGRIKFPGVLYVYASTLDEITRDVFPGTLNVLVGQPLLFGWHLAMYHALTTSEDAWIVRLWQAALTVTMHVVVNKSAEQLATDAMQAMDKMATVASAVDESWPSFALKVALATRSKSKVGDKLTLCVDAGIRYQRAALHRCMLAAATSYHDKINPSCHAAFLAFESKHGKAMLTKKWSNMNRLITLCSQEVDRAKAMWDDTTTSDLVIHVLEYASWCVSHAKYDLEDRGITVEWLDKSRDGTPGHVYLLLAKLQLKTHLASLVAELPSGSSTRADLLKVFEYFRGYACFQDTFDDEPTPPAQPGGAPTPAAQAQGQGPVLALEDANAEAEVVDVDKFERIKNLFSNKTAQALLDFLFDVFAGDHDQDLTKWCRGVGKGAVALLSWNDLDGEIKTKYLELNRQLGLHKSLISSSNAGAPPGPSSRSLKRALSTGGDTDGDESLCVDAREKEMKREREETWKNAQAARKRLVSFSVNKSTSSADIQKWMDSRHPTINHFKGEVGKSHRVFLFSAELFGNEQASDPWQHCSSTDSFEAVMEYICSQRGPHDTLMVFDGRIAGQTRRDLSKKMEGTRNSTEVWIIYLESSRFGRRVAWSPTNRELGWISFPQPLVQIAAKERVGVAKEWAPSTRTSTYERVPTAPWDSLPLISLEEKKTILGREPARTKNSVFECDRGIPLYWGERRALVGHVLLRRREVCHRLQPGERLRGSRLHGVGHRVPRHLPQ